MISIILTLIAAYIFIRIPRSFQFLVFSLSSFYQLTLGNIGAFPSVLLIEWITPVFFLILLNEIIPLNILRTSEKSLNFSGLQIFIFAIILLIICTVVSYVNNEIFKTVSHFNKGTGIKRTYFIIFNNILIYFTTIFYFAKHSAEFDVKKWIKIMLIVSILLGFLRIVTYLLGVNLSFLTQFTYGGMGEEYGGHTLRLSGLDEVSLVTIAALMADFYSNKKINILFTICTVIILFASGGRTIMIGSIIAVSIYSIFFVKKTFFYILAFGAISIIIILLITPTQFVEGQIGRITNIGGDFEKQNIQRALTYKVYLQNFKKNPIFGKGISEYSGFLLMKRQEDKEFVKDQQFSGGHGSYLSLLGVFGITGLLFFLCMILGTIILSYVKIKKYFTINSSVCALSIFVFIQSIALSIYSITSYNGFGIQFLFLNAGLISSIKINENLNKIFNKK